MSFPRYPEYKDSGVAWLGQVPTHWDVLPLKRFLRLQSGESITSEEIEDEGPFPVYGGGGLRGYTSRFTHDGSYALIGRQGALCGNVNYGDGKFWASEHSIVATPTRPLVTRWLGEMLRAMNLNQYSISAAQPGLSVDLVGRIPAAFPPISEQHAIAAFLDRETAKIDALVAEQLRLMNLLTEKRQAVISHAVTKGLNPDAPMKPSGVEWLGDVPAHWEVLAMKRFVRLQSGDSITAEQIDEEGDFPVYGGGGLRGYTSKFTHDGFYALIGRQGALCGNINFGDGKFWASEHAVVATPTRPLTTRWLGEMLSAMKLNQYSISAAQPGLSVDLVGRIPAAFPPVTEQSAIAALLDRESAKIDALVAAAEQAIALLSERRTALISAAVTGQMDIRGFSAIEVA